MRRSFVLIVVLLATALLLAGCNSNRSRSPIVTASPGAIPEPVDPDLDALIHPSWSGRPTALPEIILPQAITDTQALQDAARYYDAGMLAFDDSQWEAAIAHFHQALQLNPRHALAHNFRGAAYRHIGSEQSSLDVYLSYNDLAILDFTRATIADPTLSRAFNNRGASLARRAAVEPIREYRQAWLASALTDFSQAIAIGAEGDQAYCNRSQVFSALGQCDQAQSDAALCSSRYVEVTTQYHECAGNHEQALSVLEAAVQHAYTSDLSMLYDQEGDIYLELGMYERALNRFDLSLSTYQGPFPPGLTLYGRAAAEYYLGRFEEAKNDIAQGECKTWVRWGVPYYYLGMMAWQDGKTGDALVYLEWAERTLDDGDLLNATRQAIQKLKSGAVP